MTSTKLVGNSIGKFRLSVEHSKQNITHFENRAGSGALTPAFNRYLPCRNAKQLPKPRIKHPWLSELFFV